jgi:hypothetical protein
MYRMPHENVVNITSLQYMYQKEVLCSYTCSIWGLQGKKKVADGALAGTDSFCFWQCAHRSNLGETSAW